MICGRGAAAAAISMLENSTRKPGMFSQPTTALHDVADHDDWRLRGKAVVNRAQHEGLRAAAGFARAGEPMRVNVRQRREKIQRADAVPGLQSHERDAPKLAAGSFVAKLRWIL